MNRIVKQSQRGRALIVEIVYIFKKLSTSCKATKDIFPTQISELQFIGIEAELVIVFLLALSHQEEELHSLKSVCDNIIWQIIIQRISLNPLSNHF